MIKKSMQGNVTTIVEKGCVEIGMYGKCGQSENNTTMCCCNTPNCNDDKFVSECHVGKDGTSGRSGSVGTAGISIVVYIAVSSIVVATLLL